jgi:hypothetical protein
MQVRVLNNSSEDFYQVWLGVGGREHKTEAFGSLAAGEMSAYHQVPSAYYGYGKVNVTLADMTRLPTIVIPSPDQGGPSLSVNGRYTLIYEQQNGQWQIRLESDGEE